jgi:hypothetical protein
MTNAKNGYNDSISTRRGQGEAGPASQRRGSYLAQLEERRDAEATRKQIGFGLILGWGLMLLSAFQYFCVPSRLDPLWEVLSILGGVAIGVALLVPSLLRWPERAWMALGQVMGKVVMTILLSVIYFTMFWPAGVISRLREGSRSFHSWQSGASGAHEGASGAHEGWNPLARREAGEELGARTRARSMPLLFGEVLGFFFRQGHYIVLPILVMVLCLGLILFFVQSSVLAPFIYTIF